MHRTCSTRYRFWLGSRVKLTPGGRVVAGAFLAHANMMLWPPRHSEWCRQSYTWSHFKIFYLFMLYFCFITEPGGWTGSLQL